MYQLPEHNEQQTLERAAVRVRLRRRQRATQQRNKWLARISIACGAILPTLFVVGWLATTVIAGRRVLPGVTVRSLDLGWSTRAEAQSLIDQSYQAFLNNPVILTFKGESWRPTADEIGIRIESGRVAEESIALGTHVAPFNLLRVLLLSDAVKRELPLRVTVDERRLQSYVLQIAATVEQAPLDAQLHVVGGRAVVLSAQAGQQVLVDETVRDAIAALQRLEQQAVPVRTRELEPHVGNEDVAEAAQRAQQVLAESLTLITDGQSWTWSPVELSTLLKLEQDTASGSLRLEFDQELLKTRLSGIAAAIERPAVEPRLRFTSSGLREIAPGRPGTSLDVERATMLLVEAMRNGVRTVQLPTRDVLPAARTGTFASLGIVELVAQGKSDFSGSAPYRIQNIQAGAARMDGVLIAPGTEFSFNRHIGAIDATNGFTEGYAIINGRTQLEWGGGVCQVSTTVFRAAFWAGVPIIERNQHSFRIRWYEVYEPIGMDAAIFTGPGGYDLRFANDTGSWLLLEAYVNLESDTLTVNLYGTRPAREVRQLPVEIGKVTPAPDKPRYVDDPSLPAGTLRQTDTARGGLDVTVRRVVLEDGQVVREDRFFSRYQPWPDIFVRGTGS